MFPVFYISYFLPPHSTHPQSQLEDCKAHPTWPKPLLCWPRDLVFNKAKAVMADGMGEWQGRLGVGGVWGGVGLVGLVWGAGWWEGGKLSREILCILNRVISSWLRIFISSSKQASLPSLLFWCYADISPGAFQGLCIKAKTWKMYHRSSDWLNIQQESTFLNMRSLMQSTPVNTYPHDQPHTHKHRDLPSVGEVFSRLHSPSTPP